MPNNKYNQLKRQYSIDGGLTWHDLLPMVYKVGNVIETNSDCTDSDGCRWVVLPITEAYDCDSNYNMYQVEAEECLNQYGVFVRSGNIRRYRLIEDYSLACGYSGPICTPTSITSSTYDIVYNGGDVEWNEVATPVVYKITTISVIDKGCNETITTNREEITDYTITYSPSGDNTTEEDRTVTATVTYSGATIGSFDYIQKSFVIAKLQPFEKTELYSSNITPHSYVTGICDYNAGYAFAYSTMLSDTKLWTREFILDLTNGDLIYHSIPNHLLTSTLKGNGECISYNPYGRVLFEDRNEGLYYYNGNGFTKFYQESPVTTVALTQIETVLVLFKYDDSSNDFDDIGKPVYRPDEYIFIDDINVSSTRDMTTKFTTKINEYFILGEYDGTYIYPEGNYNYIIYKGEKIDVNVLEIFENRYAFMVESGMEDSQRLYIYDIQNDNFMRFYYDNTYFFDAFDYPFLWLDENTIYFTVIGYEGEKHKDFNFTFNTITNEVKLHTNEIIYYYGKYGEYSINFYSEKYDLYFDFDYVRTLDSEDKLHNIDFRSLYNCDYYIMNAVGVVRFYTDTEICRLLKGYTNAKEVIAYFDANYEKAQDSTRLCFEFDGESCYYRMNSKSYTATTSPYDVTFSDLGFTGTLTGCSSMFGSQSSLTSVIKLPDTSNVTTMKNMFYGCTNLVYLDANEIVTNNVTNMNSMFSGCSALTTLDVSGWDVNNVTNMGWMFDGCSNLKELDLSSWNTSNVNYVTYAFRGCSSLETLKLPESLNINNGQYLFKNCSSLTSITTSSLKTYSVTIMEEMFANCSSLTELDLSSWYIRNLSSYGLRGMFSGCTSLHTLNISGWDISNTTDRLDMFSGCTSLQNIEMNNIKANDLSDLFKNMPQIQKVNCQNASVSAMTDASYMFANCSGVTEIDLSGWNIKNLKNIESMFENCTSLTTINFSGWNWNTTYPMYDDVFKNCNSLTTIYASNIDFDMEEILGYALGHAGLTEQVTIIK